MATYAIGDIQGCYDEFSQLLDQVRFDTQNDSLWLVGDLVNRGPNSLGVLRRVRSLGDAAITVLGNHDLHLLAVAEGAAELHRSDTLDEILNAPDCDELMAWLRTRKLLHVQNDWVLVHAGLLPSWTVQQARELALEVEAALCGDHYHEFLAHMYGNQPDRWDEELSGYKRLRVVTNSFTRLRICSLQGEMEFRFKGDLAKMPAGYMPWFDVPGRASSNATIVCGHWSALGLKVTPQVIALDTGCLWGGSMTAIRLEDREIFQARCSISVSKDW